MVSKAILGTVDDTVPFRTVSRSVFQIEPSSSGAYHLEQDRIGNAASLLLDDIHHKIFDVSRCKRIADPLVDNKIIARSRIGE